MNTSYTVAAKPWPEWRKFLFCFFFIFLGLEMSPWTWLDSIPGVSYVTNYYSTFMDWLVQFSNDKFFHVRKVLVPPNGSGDTSYGWAQTWLLISLGLIGAIVWRIADRNRKQYHALNYWLCLFVRYYLAIIAFVYGFDKIFLLQMPFPNISQLATPLGDFLPMRFSWLFIGYSGPYQFFSGVMEVAVGVLLLYRRTATFGVLMATAVFTNVMMLNLSYDIPVKIFSMELVLMSLFLVANEYDRILCFFVLNRPAPSCALYHREFNSRKMRIVRILLKTVIIIIAVPLQLYNTYQQFSSNTSDKTPAPITKGMYDVPVFIVNNDTMRYSSTDTLRWKDVIFDVNKQGSIKTADTSLRQRYRRGYFIYSTDTIKRILELRKSQSDSLPLLTFHYEIPDSNKFS